MYPPSTHRAYWRLAPIALLAVSGFPIYILIAKTLNDIRPLAEFIQPLWVFFAPPLLFVILLGYVIYALARKKNLKLWFIPIIINLVVFGALTFLMHGYLLGLAPMPMG